MMKYWVLGSSDDFEMSILRATINTEACCEPGSKILIFWYPFTFSNHEQLSLLEAPQLMLGVWWATAWMSSQTAISWVLLLSRRVFDHENWAIFCNYGLLAQLWLWNSFCWWANDEFEAPCEAWPTHLDFTLNEYWVSCLMSASFHGSWSSWVCSPM